MGLGRRDDAEGARLKGNIGQPARGVDVEEEDLGRHEQRQVKQGRLAKKTTSTSPKPTPVNRPRMRSTPFWNVVYSGMERIKWAVMTDA